VPASGRAASPAPAPAATPQVCVDSVILHDEPSSYMQQAAHITHGLSLQPQVKQALLQYLLSVYAADSETRKLLQLPKPDAVEFKASCFCHKRAIDIGYVCSVCLSIFCQPTKECSTCSTKFG
jgi:transcription initiation factor TFIIH subunit 3